MVDTTIEYDVCVDDYPLNIYQGETWNLSVTVLDSNDLPVPLSGYSVQMQVRESANGPALIDLTVGAGITVNTSTSEIAFTMSDSVTAALEFMNARYDIFIKSGGGVKTPLLKGPCDLTRRMTRMA